ncbi:UNVERIFIED_CONTAM: hypothetical protein Cloal_4314 [Acetivibrio alkalicellulosi]
MNIGTWIGISLVFIIYFICLVSLKLYGNMLENIRFSITEIDKERIKNLKLFEKSSFNTRLIVLKITEIVLFISFLFLIAYIWGNILHIISNYGLTKNSKHLFIISYNENKIWYLQGVFIGSLLAFIINELIIRGILKKNYIEYQRYKIFKGDFLGSVRELKIGCTIIVILSIIYTFVFTNWNIKFDQYEIKIITPINLKGQVYSYESIEFLYKIYAKDDVGNERIYYELVFSDDRSINSKNYLIDAKTTSDIWSYISKRTDKEIEVIKVNTTKFRTIKDLEI